MVDASADSPNELDRIVGEIRRHCAARFQKGDPIHYLSALGVELGDDLKRLKYLTNKGLAEFIRNRSDLELEVIQLGAVNNIFAVTPKSKHVYQHHTIDVSEQKKENRPRLHYRFWAAFAVPLTNTYRYIDVESLSFEDLAEETPPSPGLLHIASELIPPVDANNRDDLIWRSVNRWVDDNSLELGRFIDHSSRPRTADRRVGGSILEAMIEALDPRQRQSITLPLDVIEALLSAKK
jgi:hypothetical protein